MLSIRRSLNAPSHRVQTVTRAPALTRHLIAVHSARVAAKNGASSADGERPAASLWSDPARDEVSRPTCLIPSLCKRWTIGDRPTSGGINDLDLPTAPDRGREQEQEAGRGSNDKLDHKEQANGDRRDDHERCDQARRLVERVEQSPRMPDLVVPYFRVAPPRAAALATSLARHPSESTADHPTEAVHDSHRPELPIRRHHIGRPRHSRMSSADAEHRDERDGSKRNTDGNGNERAQQLCDEMDHDLHADRMLRTAPIGDADRPIGGTRRHKRSTLVAVGS
jgi:hypothetical protein